MAYRAAVAVLNKITSNKDIFLQSSFLHLPFTFFFFFFFANVNNSVCGSEALKGK